LTFLHFFLKTCYKEPTLSGKSVALNHTGIIDGKKLNVQRHDVQSSLKEVCPLVNKLLTQELTMHPKCNYSYSSMHTLFSPPLLHACYICDCSLRATICFSCTQLQLLHTYYCSGTGVTLPQRKGRGLRSKYPLLTT
jgi:hypothetical protein